MTKDDRRAAVLADLMNDSHRLLVTILVGNNLVNIAIASIITLIVSAHLSGGIAVMAATLLASSIVLVFGEILPKAYGLGNAREWALIAARPIVVVELLLYPLVVVFDVLTRYLSRVVGGDRKIERQYASTERPPRRDQ